MNPDLLRMPADADEAVALAVALRSGGLALLPPRLMSRSRHGRLCAHLDPVSGTYRVSWVSRAGVTYTFTMSPTHFGNPEGWSVGPRGNRRGLTRGASMFRTELYHGQDTQEALPFFTAFTWAMLVANLPDQYPSHQLHYYLLRVAVVLAPDAVRDTVERLAETWDGDPADLIPTAEATLL